MSKKTFKIFETKEKVFNRDCFMCICGNSIFQYGTPQLAHRIPQNKMMLKRYGEKIIHHPENFKSTCSLKCNKNVDVGMNNNKILEVLKDILKYEKRQNGVLVGELEKHIKDLER